MKAAENLPIPRSVLAGSSLWGRIRGGLRDLSRATGVYGLANALNVVFPFLALPVLTRTLSPADFGLYTVFVVLLNFAVPMTSLSMGRAVARQRFRDGVQLPSYISTALRVTVISTVGLTLLAVSCSRLLGFLSGFPARWMWVPVVASFGQGINTLGLYVLQVHGRPVAFGCLKILQTALIYGGIIVFSVFGDHGGFGAFIGHSLALMLVSSLVIGALHRSGLIKPPLDSEAARHLISYGVPLIPHTIGVVSMAMVDRLILGHTYGLAEAGIYAAAYQAGMVIFFVHTPLIQAWIPWLFQRLGSGDKEDARVVVGATYAAFLLLVVTTVAIVLFGTGWTRIYLGADFASGAYLVPWLAVGFCFHGFYELLSNVLHFAERTGLLSMVSVFAATTNVVGNLIFIPRFGALGAAWATIGAYVIAFILTWYASVRALPLPWFDWRADEATTVSSS